MRKTLQGLGATGYTVTDARGTGSRGIRSAGWSSSSNIRIEVVCDERVAARIADSSSRTLLRRLRDDFLRNGRQRLAARQVLRAPYAGNRLPCLERSSLRSATDIIATDSRTNKTLIALRMLCGEMRPWRRGPICPPINTPGISQKTRMKIGVNSAAPPIPLEASRRSRPASRLAVSFLWRLKSRSSRGVASRTDGRQLFFAPWSIQVPMVSMCFSRRRSTCLRPVPRRDAAACGFRIRLLGDDQVQRTGRAAAGHDDLPKIRALHRFLVIVQGKSAGGLAFAEPE